uniref:DYW domain-containing protein n=1 Tax=Cajanus cajan TaxID=3821 RepID=A0A151QYR4_CAJCA|nr:hypothetical protein KK1_043566 [Cajanus cajan]
MLSLSLCLPSSVTVTSAIHGSSDAKDLNFESVARSLSARTPHKLLKACIRSGNLELGKLLHQKLTESGLDLDSLLLNSLISLYSKCGEWENALSIFRNMGSNKRDLVSWSAIISCFANNSMESRALVTFLRMLQHGIYPNEYCFTASIRACSNAEYLPIGRVIFGFVLKTGYFDSHVCVGCALIDMLIKGGADIESARMVFEKMQDKNVVTWNLMITRFAQLGLLGDAVDLFCRMLVSGYTPDSFTLTSLLSSCAEMELLSPGKQLHSWVIRSGLGSDVCVGCSLVDMYAKCGSVENCRKMFNRMPRHNVMSWTALISGYVQGRQEEEAIKLFCNMLPGHVAPNCYTFSSVIKACANLPNFGFGKQLHGQTIKLGLASINCVGNSLINMYARCGNKEAALEVFNDMGDRNVITWTSVISGFAKHGFATKALELFYEMLEIGVKPNDVTYIAVLSACSHVGLIDEAWKHFNSMHYNHGVVPRMEHYACMVDLLGRSGFLLEAIDFINSMPFDADALVWRTFLGSCRVHRNTKLGEHAAKMILEREPRDPATYILLSNLYASEGRWDDVAAIRKSMKQKRLIKETGYSWIEVDNQVHKFHVGDTSHPQAQKIYDELDELALKIKNLGYVPNTDYVLHDVEDEQKEQYLFQHSEKIAVAFALISTLKSKPIRVFKNLRVCGDCHTAIKYISIVTGREIVVRDANRFHHIKDGKCSCNDYW